MSTLQQFDGQYDYIIVGAGTAGCVLANRLSADGKSNVLLLEAGGSDRYHWVDIPVGYLYCMGNPRTDWMMKTAHEPSLNDRSLSYPRGKVLGGCSSINGMIYMRGQAADYDGWRQLGNAGWAWDDVLPYFLKSENNHHGASDVHETGGEWHVSKQRLSWPILEAFGDAAAEIGIPRTNDFNSGDNTGSGFFDVNQKHGVRWNTSKAFLRPALKRPNLRVVKNAHTKKIVLDGNRASGVAFTQSGKHYEVNANNEILLCAGAINSPQLLELSGIGQAEHLKALGIEVRHELNGVGENLQDHLQIRTVYKVQNAKTLNQKANSFLGKVGMVAEYTFKRSGPLSMAPSQFGIFTKSDAGKATPDLEYHVQPLSTDKLGDPLHDFPAVTVSVCNLRPESVGSCHIESVDHAAQPNIQLNYLSTYNDQQVALRSIEQVRVLMATNALKEFVPTEISPGADVIGEDALMKAIGDIATTIFHPVGTCKMGDDAMAVVDDQLCVHGIDGLRVVDASIMPRIVSGNTASPVIMIAEKAADMILAARK